MKIPFTNLEIRKVPVSPAPRDRLVQACADVTEAWYDCYQLKENVIPWIDWQTKEVFAAQRGSVEKIT